MRSSLPALLFASLTTLLLSTTTAGAEPILKPEITTTMEGRDLRVVVRGVTDYCTTDADTRIMRTSGSIRIVRDRPSRVSGCFSKQSIVFVVKDVAPGTYTVSYERMPLVAPANPRRVAFVTAFVP